MHDDTLERQLRTALRTEAEHLPLTITTAEMERRLALRQRGRSSRVPLVLVAALVGLAFASTAFVAGGWLDRNSVVVPVVPTDSAAPTESIAPSPSGSPARAAVLPSIVLPSIEDLIASVDPATIVRAQAVGPAEGPSPDDPTQSRGMWFAPTLLAGTYRVSIACLGIDALDLRQSGTAGVVQREGLFRSAPRCDGSVHVLDIGMLSGDSVLLTSATSASWRLLIQAPARPAHQPGSIAPVLTSEADEVLADVSSQRSEPDYLTAFAGEPIVENFVLGGIPNRDTYHVYVSCAGPAPIEVALDDHDQGLAFMDVATLVECDGTLQLDELGIRNAPAGATLSVRADPRVAWHVVVTAERPPVSIAPDEGDWTTLIARGPDFVEREPPGLSSLLDAPSNEIRIVVSCAGGGTKVDVAVTTGLNVPVGTFTADCPAGDVGTTARSFQLPDRSFVITTKPDAPMWLVVTVQERLGSRKS